MKKIYPDSAIQKSCFLPLFLFILISFSAVWSSDASENPENYLIDENSPSYITDSYWENTPAGGDTIFIASERTKAIKICNIHGDDNNPIVVINKGGVVRINDTDSWGAIDFNECSHIKISGQGHPEFKYGFELKANSCGLAFSGLSSDCEAEFIHVNHDGFFGIMAKKDYGGNPPSPAPVFSNLVIHDCFIENVTEGMYLGETKSPGMEFKHVKIYNNIVKNTGREAIQIANMTEDVEIFNNTLLNAGNDGDYSHGNLLQIGDNTVARVYNNVMIGAHSNAIISFGMGNNEYSNNFISQSKGVFIDNRKFSTPGAQVLISDNFFRNVKGEKVIKNMNEINPIEIRNNTWNTDILFYENASGNDSNFVLTNNQNQPVDSLWFTNPAENDYSLADGVSSLYQNMGAPGGPWNSAGETSDENEEEDTTEPRQIVLTSDMIIDEVEGGSYHSPQYLVDEQDFTPGNNEHPVSESWKPRWNMDHGPYHVTIDLKNEYHLSEIAFHDMHNAKNLEVSTGEPGNWKLLFTENCDKYKAWKEHTVDVTTRYIRLSMTESVYAAVNEMVVFGNLPNNSDVQNEDPISEQINLKAEMITDEVPGGSYYSPEFLVDEQDCTPENEIHPVSESWKPHWNMENGPYHVIIDLQAVYHLTNISLHDMHNAKNLEISVGEPGNWELLFTETCDKYKTWKEHDIEATTRYIRLSMTESVYAAINELVVFGYPANEEVQKKSAPVDSQNLTVSNHSMSLESPEINLFPNPAVHEVKVRLTPGLNENFQIEIFNHKGQLAFRKNFDRPFSDEISINLSAMSLKEGMYILKYSNHQGMVQTRKFMKTNI